jgi:hypothetical protein
MTFVPHGYVVVIQADGYDTAAWIASQPSSDRGATAE